MTEPPRHRLRLAGRTLEVGGPGARPLVMGVVNASPDSFSDPQGAPPGTEACVERGRTLVAAGADLIDVGGQSNVTDRPPVSAAEEVERVTPVVEALAAHGTPVAVDTYKPEVARAAVAAGAGLVNDVSGLADPDLARVCAETGAGLVVMHTRVPPKRQRFDPGLDGRAAGDVLAFLRERCVAASALGVAPEQLVLDPGPDFGKTPAQTVEILRRLGDLRALARPVLLAVSRKDFVGAITGRGPAERLGGTLAAIAHGVDAGVHLLRVHDVREVADFLAVRAVLRGDVALDPQTRLPEPLRRVR